MKNFQSLSQSNKCQQIVISLKLQIKANPNISIKLQNRRVNESEMHFITLKY